jgi:soluble lytic murein transglycosylase-like protein
MPEKRSRLDIAPPAVRSFAKELQRRYRKSSFRTRRLVTLLMGAALSVGGVSEALEGSRFLVAKDLDQARLVRQTSAGNTVVASVSGNFAANSLYKLARAVPDSIISQQQNLLDSAWLRFPGEAPRSGAPKAGFSFISEAVSKEFFSTLPYGSLIHEKARKYDVDPALVAAVIEAESRFKVKAKSPVGARGLMQLMPRTGAWMGAKDLYNAEQNVDAGVKYLKYLDARFDGNLRDTIAAYNAGEGTVKRYGGIPPYRETRTYVKRVMTNYEKRNRELQEFTESMAAETAEVEAR